MAQGLAGFLRGAAAVAVPMLLEQEKEKQIADRDTRLATLQETAAENARKAQAAESKLDREAKISEGKLDRDANQQNADRTFAMQENTAIRANVIDTASLALEATDSKERSKLLDANAKAAEQAYKSGAITLEQQQAQNDLLLDAMNDTNPESRKKTIDFMNEIFNQSKNRNRFGSLKRTSQDDSGNTIQESDWILNRETGEAHAPSGAQPGGSVARPTTEAEYNALPSGTVFIDPEDGKQYRKP